MNIRRQQPVRRRRPLPNFQFSIFSFQFSIALVLLAFLASPRPALAYIEIAYPLGRVLAEAANIVQMRVESVDREKNTIIFRKVADIKGKHAGDVIKHNIARGGFNPREWQNIMAWAEPGQTALFFYNGGASETCINNYWYQTYAGGEWWNMSHGEPYLLRAYAGKPEKLIGIVQSLMAGQEVIVPCMVDGDKNALQLRTARLQRMKASLKIQDYNPQRDFAGWGVEEFKAIADMPGFTHQTALAKVSPNAAGVAPCDFDGDGKIDYAVFGEGRFVLLQNAGGSMNETPLPVPNATAASWADCNGDGRADLLVATSSGHRLFLNEPKGFRDATGAVPGLPYPHPRACTWIDFDGDKRPDIMVADGFRGLRLYRNKTAEIPPGPSNTFTPWLLLGPFANEPATSQPEKEPFDRNKEYTGRDNLKLRWRELPLPDGQVNDLCVFKPEHNESFACYLYREIEMNAPMGLPCSFGSDDTLDVWLNGKKILTSGVARPCAPDQHQVNLKLVAGKNTLLMKICNLGMGAGFYFQPKAPIPPPPLPLMFEDCGSRLGLGSAGIGSFAKGDHLAVADVNNDGRPDILYSVGTGVLILNTPERFVQSADSGLSYQAGKVAPAFADFDGDKNVDLFVPQPTGGKLFKGDGKGRFTDVTAKAGDLAAFNGNAACAVWADVGNTGRLDLLVGCIKGPNRYFRNNGNGTFTDATEAIGLDRRIFNTRGLAVVDMNRDGAADLVLANEGQESAALLGNPAGRPK